MAKTYNIVGNLDDFYQDWVQRSILEDRNKDVSFYQQQYNELFEKIYGVSITAKRKTDSNLRKGKVLRFARN